MAQPTISKKMKKDKIPEGSVSDPHGSALILVVWILVHIGNADPDPGGQKLPTKIEKSFEIPCFEVPDDLF
jgi:hypothetical protein